MQEANVPRAVAAGFIATIVTEVLMYIGGGLGFAIWNLAGITGSALGFGKGAQAGFNEFVEPLGALWLWGLACNLVFMIFVAPLCYGIWSYNWLRGPNWFRGVQVGWFIWFVQQMLFMPLVGTGVFDRSGPDTGVEIISWFVLWTIYGFVLGAAAGPQRIWRSYLEEHPEHSHQWPHVHMH